MSYDQWKTASPYDDDPDVVEICEKLAIRIDRYIKTHAELSDINQSERTLLEECHDVLNMAATFVNDNI